ncbi:MAG: regulatory protein RecX [Lachnospiraceae bacterium]|nr:regulatory protein RecX [Lachnospiraceae bacterium]MBD5483482.1 regulatory protein RecX [Lachnospiraceae bacterium]
MPCIRKENEMVVIEITELTKAKSLVTLDDGMSFALYRSELRRYRLREGEPIADAVYEELFHTELPKRAKLRCMNLLKQRDYTESELSRKLENGGYPDEIIQIALDYVKSYGYVDDESYVRKYIDTYRDRKSMMRIETDLLKKGISRDTVRNVCEKMDFSDGEDAELLQIQTLLIKKGYREDDCTPEQRRKLYAFLVRRGYPASKIARCMKGLSLEDA